MGNISTVSQIFYFQLQFICLSHMVQGGLGQAPEGSERTARLENCLENEQHESGQQEIILAQWL